MLSTEHSVIPSIVIVTFISFVRPLHHKLSGVEQEWTISVALSRNVLSKTKFDEITLQLS